MPGAYPGGMHRMHVHPPSPPVHPPPPNKKKMQVCLPKHNYKLDINLLPVEPRAVDPHCFDADPDPYSAQNLDADPDPDRDPGGGGGGVANPKMCNPPGKILGTPLLCALTKSEKALGVRSFYNGDPDMIT